jgi:hypothetical protein
MPICWSAGRVKILLTLPLILCINFVGAYKIGGPDSHASTEKEEDT